MTISSCAETAEQCPTAGQQLSPGGKASRANLEPCPSGFLVKMMVLMMVMMMVRVMVVVMVSPGGKASRANLEPCPSGLLIMFIMVMAMMMVIMTMAIMVIGHSDGPDDFVNVVLLEGCCPFAGWYCCGEGMGSGLCAMDPADCP